MDFLIPANFFGVLGLLLVIIVWAFRAGVTQLRESALPTISQYYESAVLRLEPHGTHPGILMTYPAQEKREFVTASSVDGFRGIFFLTIEAIFVHEIVRMRSPKYHYAGNLMKQWELPGDLRYHTFDSIAGVTLTSKALTLHSKTNEHISYTLDANDPELIEKTIRLIEAILAAPNPQSPAEGELSPAEAEFVSTHSISPAMPSVEDSLRFFELARSQPAE